MRRTLASLILFCSTIAALPARSQDYFDRILYTAVTYDDGAGTPLRGALGMFWDERAQELFVLDASNRRVVIFDAVLQAKFSFEHFVFDRSSGRLIPGEPRSLATNSDGDIFLIDNLCGYIDQLDFRGTPVARIYPAQAIGDTMLNLRPELLATDAADNLYILVSGDQHTVIVLDRLQQFVRTIGKRGADSADFNTVTAMTVSNSRLLIADMYAVPGLKIFDTSGVFLRGFSGHAVERSDFSFATGLALATDTAGIESLWLTDNLRQVIKVLDLNGAFLAHVGGFGILTGEFRYPQGIASTKDGHFFVVERVGNRIQKFLFR